MSAAVQPISAPSVWLTTIDQLLREPAQILERIRAGEDLLVLSRTMLSTIGVSGALFGGALGAYHGGVQIAFAALKLPFVILLTACICAPVLTMTNRALGRMSSLPKDLALVLSALALGSLVIAALAPLLLLAGLLQMSYHQAILVTFGACSLGGLAGLSFLWRGLQGERGSLWATFLVLGAFAVAGSQMSWTFRPYLVRPKTVEVPFIREVEGNLFESILQTYDSARGRYTSDARETLEMSE